MYVTRVPNRSSPPAILLRESYREGGRVKTRTLANLSNWPGAKVEALRRVLRGETLLVPAARFEIERALPHGHVAAVLGQVRQLGLDRQLPRRPERLGKLALALIVARVIEPAAKLSTARQLSEATASHSLGAMLGLGEVDEDELYRALDLLGAAQSAIERALARRHLKDGTLVLYDVTSSYLEGRCCELGQRGYSRDGRPDRPQIVFGLLCAADGCPVAVEVFAGDTGDPKTLAVQIDKLKKRFGMRRVALVGDRGMITTARIEHDLKPAGLDWITALRAPARRWQPTMGAYSCRSSTTATWPRSSRPTIRASGSSYAATGFWRRSGRASARTCSPPPKRISPKSRQRQRAPATPSGARPTSRSRSAPCWGGARSPSTSG